MVRRIPHTPFIISTQNFFSPSPSFTPIPIIILTMARTVDASGKVAMNNSVQQSSIETPPRAPSPTHRFGTRAVHVGSHIDPTTGAVISPVCETCNPPETRLPEAARKNQSHC